MDDCIVISKSNDTLFNQLNSFYEEISYTKKAESNNTTVF